MQYQAAADATASSSLTGDVLELQRQLTASEAYNRFMARRAQQLERELALFKEARVESAAIAKTFAAVSTSDAASASSSGGGSLLRRLQDAEKQLESVMGDNTRLRVEARRVAQERDVVTADLERTSERLAACEAELKGSQAKNAAFERELAELRELLPPALQRKAAGSTRTRRRGSSRREAAGEENAQADETVTRRRSRTITTDVASDNDVPSAAAGGSADGSDAEGDGDGPRDDADAGRGDDADGANEEGAAADENAAEGDAAGAAATTEAEVCTLVPLFDPGTPVKQRAEEVELRLKSLEELAGRAEQPPSVAAAVLLCDRTRQAFVDLRVQLERIPAVVSQLQSARRSALSVIVECQALSGDGRAMKALRSRMYTYDREVQRRRADVAAVMGEFAPRVPLAAGGLLALATVLAGLAVRFPAASGSSTVRLMDQTCRTTSRFSLFDVNYVQPLLKAQVLVKVDNAIAKLAGVAKQLDDGAEGATFPKFDIEQLKDMSNECRETSATGQRYSGATEFVATTLTLIADLRRLVAVPRSQGVIPEADEAEAANAEAAADGDAAPRGPVTRSTQVNFYLLKSIPTETDAKVAQLASIKQPWFECLQNVRPITPRRGRRSSTPSPRADRTGSPGNASSSAPHGDDDNAEGGEDAHNETMSSIAPTAVTPRRARRSSMLPGHDVSKTVAEALERYREAGIPVPSNFRCVRGDVYQFGERRVALVLVDGTLAARIGGGFVSFEEYCGMHYAAEERRLRLHAISPRRRTATPGRFGPTAPAEEAAPRPQLPDTPLVRNRRPKSARRTAANPDGSGSPREMDDALKSKLRAMGFTEDDFKLD